MKHLACVCLLFASAVYAGTDINLPSPVVNTYYPTTMGFCTAHHDYRSAETAANGFSADGNYVLGVSQGYAVCGCSGHAGGCQHTYYCMLDMWDLAGNLVSVTLPATCPAKQSNETFTNQTGYEAYTVTDFVYGYISKQFAVLVTP